MNDEYAGYVDPDGQPIDFARFNELLAEQDGFRVVAEDTIGAVRVRTMWSGVREPAVAVHPFGSAFVFADGGIREIEQYDSRDDALQGHARLVAALAGRQGARL